MEFEHYFFKKVEDIYFRLDPASKQPLAIVSLGAEEVSLSFAGIQKEFNIPSDSHDGALLALMAKGLNFVKGLRIGDPIPKEILSGDPSWEPKTKHRQIAYNRLAVQILGWLSGDEHIITNPDELVQVAGDSTFRKQVNEAFGEAARSLGLPSKEHVTHLIEDLSHELSYIEALRDEFTTIQRAYDKAKGLRKAYAGERSQLTTVDSLLRLFNSAIEDFGERFETVDAQTGEIMSALKNLDTVKAYLKEHRNELRTRLVVWDDILLKWFEQPMRAGRDMEDLMAETYRFLAPRYMPVDKWVMMTQLQDTVKRAPLKSTDIRKDKEKVKYIGGRMSWS
ncbi:hypothetical protein [Rhodospira trueperi]|uniref:hypothetical protein n=1 Tax=Rhodospira trueperi TaxID=69960 RepID=UPI0011600050|nr:hypothetical protein [Rhodospira trueperi]